MAVSIYIMDNICTRIHKFWVYSTLTWQAVSAWHNFCSTLETIFCCCFYLSIYLQVLHDSYFLSCFYLSQLFLIYKTPGSLLVACSVGHLVHKIRVKTWIKLLLKSSCLFYLVGGVNATSIVNIFTCPLVTLCVGTLCVIAMWENLNMYM